MNVRYEITRTRENIIYYHAVEVGGEKLLDTSQRERESAEQYNSNRGCIRVENQRELLHSSF